MGRFLGVLLALSFLAGFAQADATAPAEAPSAAPDADLSRLQSSPALVQAIGASRAYWSAQEPGYPEDVRVQATTTGSFTRAGVAQRAVLYRMSLYPRGFPKQGLAILEGDRLVHNFAFVLLAEDLETLGNFAGDGRDALALEGGFGMGGQESRGLTLAAFGRDGFADLGHVDTYESICGTGREDAAGPTSARVSVAPGGGFRIERFRQASCDAEGWESLGKPEPLVLEPEEKNPFEDLSSK